MSKGPLTKLQTWEYKDTSLPAAPRAVPPPKVPELRQAPPSPPPGIPEEEVAARIRAAVTDAEQRWSTQAEALEAGRKAQLTKALAQFTEERVAYFRDAEAEIVHLALALARKILEREARLDPDLLRALVHLALERLDVTSSVRLHVPPSEVSAWCEQHAFAGARFQGEIVSDTALQEGECVLETELGTAHLGLQSQLKELETGIADLMHIRPRPISRQQNEGPRADAGQPA